MKKTLHISKYLILGGCSFIAFACSPVTPSVSKVSGVAADKTSPTSATSGSDILSTQLSQTTSTGGLFEYSGEQKTEVITLASYNALTKGLSKKRIHELNTESFSDFTLNLKAENHVTEFEIDDSERAASFISGKEQAMAQKNVRIYLIVDTPKDKINKLSLDEVSVRLGWIPRSPLAEKAHWGLSVVEPNMFSDYADANANAERVLNNLASNLVGIVVEYDARF